MGNPLLDMQVVNGEELLKKYNLKANDAILAGKEHEGMYGHTLSFLFLDLSNANLPDTRTLRRTTRSSILLVVLLRTRLGVLR